jgi:hypothetical protein
MLHIAGEDVPLGNVTEITGEPADADDGEAGSDQGDAG